MPRWPATRPRTTTPADVVRVSATSATSHDVALMSQHDRRARAFERVYPLLSTSIPTSQILASYRREIDEP